MKLPISVLALCFLTSLTMTAAELSPVMLANPMQGTDSNPNYSHGNTYPAIALPFPMSAWAPYTEPQPHSFYYNYRNHKILGIRQTHQASPWIGDYASFSLMAVTGKLAVTEADRVSVINHESEIAQPSYYRVHLDTWKASMEVTPTERAARFRFTYESDDDAYVVLDAFQKGSEVKIIPAQNKVIGICRNNFGGVPSNFASYFVIEFDQPFVASGTWTPDGIHEGKTELSDKHVGAYFKFDTSKGKVVTFKASSSYISPEQAQRNLDREIGTEDFDSIRSRAEGAWNSLMNRIKIEGGTEAQQRTFYSAVYRSFLYPHRFYEFDENNQPVYFSPHDGKIHSGYMYTDSGYWDTFRASHPLYNLMVPEISGEIMQGVIAAYDQSGFLPAWSSPGVRDCMIGNHAFSLLADAWVKGVRNFDADKAINAMVHDANTQAPETCRSIGRDGADFYQKNGYVPTSFKESTAKTLEYAYNDFCAAVLAQSNGRNAEAATFAKNAMNYTNVFDPAVGFVRGRNEDGSWREKFDPTEWGGPFTEGNAWHWTWSVFHDVPGLIQLIGGDDAFGKKLDSVFLTPPDVNVGSYGRMIHEMTEMVSANMGQYAHGNQPIQHMPYLYNYVGQPWKTQARVREVMGRLYHATPDGFSGDEDTGQMSAWYVFSALGFYPVCPGTTEYMIGSPLFDRVTIALADGKKFVITANQNGPQRPYISGAKLNGESFEKTYLTHEQLIKGGELIFDMTSLPDTKWGTAPQSRPSDGMSRLRLEMSSKQK